MESRLVISTLPQAKVEIDLYIASKYLAWICDEVAPSPALWLHVENPGEATIAARKGFQVRDNSETGTGFAISLHWPYIFEKTHLERYTTMYNIHPGILPRQRGMYPIFWAKFFGYPVGVTLHTIEERLDSGAVLTQCCIVSSSLQSAGDARGAVLEAEKRIFTDLLATLSKGRHPVPLFVPSEDLLGPCWTKSDFKRWRDSPPLGLLTRNETDSLVLALTDPDHPLPFWSQSGKWRGWSTSKT